MERAIIFCGIEETNESYQLLIGNNYTCTSYDGSFTRDFFYEDLSDAFSEKILEKNELLEIRTFNGGKINPKTGKFQTISKLEQGIVDEFSKMLASKVEAGVIKKSKENPCKNYLCIRLE